MGSNMKKLAKGLEAVLGGKEWGAKEELLVTGESVEEAIGENAIDRMAKVMVDSSTFQNMLRANDDDISDMEIFEESLRAAVKNAIVLTFEKHGVSLRRSSLADQAKRETRKAIASN